VAHNFNCRIEDEGLLKIAGSHVHCKSDDISQMVQHRDVVASDVVLKADASPRGCLEAENLMLRPHGRWLGISLVCLGLRKTASASPRPRPHCLGLALMCISLGSSNSGSPSSDSDTNSIIVTYFHVHSFQYIIAFYQHSTFYIRWFLYGILVPALPRHCFGLLLPRLEH